MKNLVLIFLAFMCMTVPSVAQGEEHIVADTVKRISRQYVNKSYDLYFDVNKSVIDSGYSRNSITLDQMQSDIKSMLMTEGVLPDSLLIISTSSPDGTETLNKRIAKQRAESTRKQILKLFPEFKDAVIEVQSGVESWDGLKRALTAYPDAPQAKEMMEIIMNLEGKDVYKELKACKEGWAWFVDNYLYLQRHSAIKMSVVVETVLENIQPMPPVQQLSYTPVFEAPLMTEIEKQERKRVPYVWRKTIVAARTNLLTPAFNIGVEFPIKDNWSVGAEYYWPWFVSKNNKWCLQLIGGFVEAKYWFPGKKYEWSRTQKLQGHAIGIYAGGGLYDLQFSMDGQQGEYMDFGVDYTFALPIASDRLRLEFNIGLGWIRTQYRPYYVSSDYSDLIAVPGVKYNTTNFFGPTRAGVSLVLPINFITKPPKELREGGKK